MENRTEFVTAEWRHLVMLNYKLNPEILIPRLPLGTELDLWQGKALVSVVGFMFLKTRIFGIPVPLYQNFEEVNMRFYVRRQAADGVRRGVVFIKEMVPSWAVAQVARTIYNESYIALPMDHKIEETDGQLHENGAVEYAWRVGPRWHRLRARSAGPARPLTAGSEEEFITQHYWGYVRQRDGGCMEYPVEHERWHVRPVRDALLETDVASLYGAEFVKPLNGMPSSAFLAEGSAVTVYCGQRCCELPMEAALERTIP